MDIAMKFLDSCLNVFVLKSFWRHDLLVLLMVAQHHHLHDVTVMYTGIYREYVAAAEEALFPVTVSPDRLPLKYIILRVPHWMV